MDRTARRVFVILAVCALLGLAFSIVATWRSVETSVAAPDDAARAFEQARAEFAGQAPVVTMEGERVTRRPPPGIAPGAPSSLHVLVYHRPSTRLIRAEIPFWFLRMKGPASETALRGTGIDLARLGLSVDDLRSYGPALVLDEQRGHNRVLLWTR